jgi:hypothetical protein
MLISPKTGSLVHPDSDINLSKFGLLVRKEIEKQADIEEKERAEIQAKEGMCFNCGIEITPNTPSRTFNSGKTLCRKCMFGK